MQRFRSTMTAVTVVTLAAAGVASITPAEASTGRAGAFRSTSTLHTASPAKRAHPHHPPATRFTHGRVDNEWFPLRPGTRLVYRGNDEGVPATDIFIVTYKTKVVDGVVCRQVFDRVVKHGKVRERTVDWYAQTERGTVWYFGERTATLDRNGQVKSRDGSFQSGRNGAEAGIFMPAHPRVGYAATQEFYPGHAQDHFRVLSLKAPAVSPAVATHHAMLSRETTPLEPGVVDHKKYVRDIGTVSENTVRGGHETYRLMSIRHIPRR
ncbi:MAG: hypothetical protein WAK18_09205 [Nocardioidaceae bacterium]